MTSAKTRRQPREDEAYAAGRLAGFEDGLQAQPADIFPNGWGCPNCDGTGFVSQEVMDRLQEQGFRVPRSDLPAEPQEGIGL